MGNQQDDSNLSDQQIDPALLSDQALRIVESTELGSFLLLSVSDDPIFLGKGTSYDDFSPYSNVQIFSESIAFTGDLLSPGGISLSCNDITTVDKVKVNTTGAAGANQVKGGSAAKDGANGGSIHFYVQSGSDDVSKRLSFVANGGKGGDVVVENDQAGNGGSGGHSVRIFQSRHSALLGTIYEFLDRKDASEDIFASPVHTNDPIYLSAFRLLTIALKATTMEKDDNVNEPIQTLRKLLSAIETSNAHTVGELVKTVKFVRNPLQTLAKSQQRDFETAVNYKGGYYGAGDGVRGKPGEQGKDGSDTFLFLPTYSPDINKTTFAFAHPEQCAMLLDRAKVFYYMGSPRLRLQAEILFQRLVYRLSSLPTNPSPIMSSNSLSKLQSIKTDTSNWLVQLATGTSFNGHPDNWAPRASYTFYQAALDSALKDHEAFEKAYIQYHDALFKKQKIKESVDLTLQQTTLLTGGLAHDISDLVERLHETENRVSSLTDPVESTHAALETAFNKIKSKIKNDFELSVPQVINALRGIAFSVTPGMTAVQGFDILYQGSKSVPDIEGYPVNKDFIIQKIQHGEATVKSIKDVLGTEVDSEFQVDEQLKTWLMTTKEDMMNFLEAYANSSFADVIDQMKDKFDAFVKAITARNEQALLYNFQLKKYFDTINSKNNYEMTKQQLQVKKIEVTDPDLPIITEYMDNIYQSSRARVMQLLDNLVRSLSYRMLKSYDIFDLAFNGTEVDKVPLTITSNVLRSGRSRIQNEFGKMVENFGSEPARFPGDFNKMPGNRIKLSKMELEDLIANKRVVMNIPAMHKGTLKKNDFSGCYNVRIYRVRFGLTGLIAKKKQARVTVNFTQSGDEVIVDRNDLGHRFVHDQITSVYTFHLDPDGTTSVQSTGNIAEPDVGELEKNYTAPGPFADWTVELINSDLAALDFSQVTEGYFDFCGTNYSF